uniref:Uncharacterized protein n=1 Tax=Onchocerca volvulus TaxID=6282 RepID=A0A8R1TQV9_ONCVO
MTPKIDETVDIGTIFLSEGAGKEKLSRIKAQLKNLITNKDIKKTAEGILSKRSSIVGYDIISICLSTDFHSIEKQEK